MTGPNRITSSATKIRSSLKDGLCTTRKQTPDGRIFVCCDGHYISTCRHGGRMKHGTVTPYWTGEQKLRKYGK